MANKMLVDATHPEETRVVVLRGNRVQEFDFESASRKQLRGNIYLAKVTRVEPSLQAAFVDYGGNRHGFLAFSEIHPDYYQIPVADRQALIEAERREIAEADRHGGETDRTEEYLRRQPVDAGLVRAAAAKNPRPKLRPRARSQPTPRRTFGQRARGRRHLGRRGTPPPSTPRPTLPKPTRPASTTRRPPNGRGDRRVGQRRASDITRNPATATTTPSRW